MERCVTIQIVDDDISLEGEETLIVEFETLPEGVLPGDNPNSMVTIVDDDTGKLHVLFLCPSFVNYVINESLSLS